MRKSGIDIVGDVPWEFHFAVAYNNIAEFKDILIPYMKAGLESNELCIIITSDNFTESDCEKIMKKDISDFSRYCKKGQVKIVPYTQWYFQNDRFSKEKAMHSARTRLDTLKNTGYEGLRIFGESSWVKRIKWPELISYEKNVHKRTGKARIITLCGYLITNFSMSEALHVVCAHDDILVKKNGVWVLIKCLKNQSIQAEFERFRQILSVADEDNTGYKRNDDLIKTIRVQIKSARKILGLTQTEVANRVGISSSFLGLVERGGRTPSFQMMRRIASVLGLNLKKLVEEIEAVPKEKNEMTEKIDNYLQGSTPREKKLIYGFIQMLIKERNA